MSSVNKTIEQLHYLRLRIGNIRQVLEIISLRVESQPIPFYAPLSENPECEPVALFPMTIQPTQMNNFIVELSSEYFMEMSAKEVEKRLNDKIKELEKQEKELEDTLKKTSDRVKELVREHVKKTSEEAQKELEGDVRNITEFMTEEEYQEMKKKPKEQRQISKIDYQAEYKRIAELVKEEEELEKQGRLEYFDAHTSKRVNDSIPLSEFGEMPAVKSTIVERKKDNNEMKETKQTKEIKEINECKEKKEIKETTPIGNNAFTGGIGERKKTVKKQTMRRSELEQQDTIEGQPQKKVSLFKQRMGKK